MLLLALLCVSWLSSGIFVAQQTAVAAGPMRGVRLPEDRLSLPTIQTMVLPKYPDESATAAVGGAVDLEVVIGVNGEVAQARVSTPLNEALDKEALNLFATAIEPSPKIPGLRDPKLLRNIVPSYTPEAMRAKIQGTVELHAVVLPDGTVGAVRVVKSLDDRYGLDQQAVEAAARWWFDPGRMNGAAVATRVTIILEFKLH